MKLIARSWVVVLLAAAALFGTVSSAEAGLKLRVDVTTTPGVDVEVADLDLDGIVSFDGPLGFFSINKVNGFSKPAHGGATDPRLDMSAAHVSTSGNRTIHLWLTDTGFTGVGAAFANIGGTTDRTVTYEAFWDPGNVEFATTNKIGSTLTFGPGGQNFPFSGSTMEGFEAAAPYSLTQHIIINHRGSDRASSFNASVHVPEPVSLALLGGGLAAFAVVRRRRGQQMN